MTPITGNWTGETPTTGEDYTLTVGQDDLTGTEYDDEFIANVSQNQLGYQANTLGTGDMLDGQTGVDTLDASLTEAAALGDNAEMAVQPITQSVENVKVEALYDQAEAGDSNVYLNAKDMEDIDTISSSYSDANLVVQDFTTQQSEGAARNTEEVTVRMDHTGNADSHWDESNFEAYFDQDYLIAEEDPGVDQINYQVMNMDAVEQGFDPLDAVNVDRFEFEYQGEQIDLGDEIGSSAPKGDDITTYQDLVDGIESALAEVNLADKINVSLGNTFTVEHPDQGSDLVGTDIKLTAPGGGALEAEESWVAINPSEEPLVIDDTIVRNSARVERADDEPGTPTQNLEIPIELDKVGRGSDGGELVVGGMSKTGDNEWDAGSGSKGIPTFNVSVEGNSEESSSLSGLRSTNNTLEEVNITTDESTYGEDEDPADLEIGNSNTEHFSEEHPLKDVNTLDASDFKGDLSVGTIDHPAVLTDEIEDKYENPSFDYDLGQGNDDIYLWVDGELPATSDFYLDINGNSGDDDINMAQYNTDGGSPTPSQFLNHSAQMNVEINGGGGADRIVGKHYGAYEINPGSGNDDVWVDEMPNNAEHEADWLLNATTDSPSGIIGSGNQTYNIFNTSLQVEFQGLTSDVVQIDSENFTTSSSDINEAVKQAIQNDTQLSDLLEVEEVENEGLQITSVANGNLAADAFNVNFIAPKYEDDDPSVADYNNDSATLYEARQEVTEGELRDAFDKYFPDTQGLENNSQSGTGIYDGDTDAPTMHNSMFNAVDFYQQNMNEDDSTGQTDDIIPAYLQNQIDSGQDVSDTLTQNEIYAGSGDDTFVLSNKVKIGTDT